jgi:hypothetical protein
VAHAETIDHCLQDRCDSATVAGDSCNGVNHVDDLVEVQVIAHLLGVLRRPKQWQSGGRHPRATSPEYGVAPVDMLE